MKMPKAILQSHANMLLEGRTFIPQKGDRCSPACRFYTWCVNYEDGAPCRGFQKVASNGKISRHIEDLLHDLSIERYIQDIQTYPEIAHRLVPVVERALNEEQRKSVSVQRNVKKPEKNKVVTLFGFDPVEIDVETGKTRFVHPKPEPEPPKIPDPEHILIEDMLIARQNELGEKK